MERVAPEAQSLGEDVARPDREIRLGRWVLIIFFSILIAGATVIRLDAAAYAQGQVVVSGQRKEVQHREGGVVGAIFVREGQQVREGEVLMRLAAADVEAQERSLSGQVIRLIARRVRLQEEIAGRASIAMPPEFTGISAEDSVIAKAAMEQEQAELQARFARLNSELASLGQRVERTGFAAEGARQQSGSATEQIRLIDEEIAALRPLAEKGFVSRTRLRALERSRAELQGQQGQFTAVTGQAGREASEVRLQQTTQSRGFRERAADELNQTLGKLGELQPELKAARDQLARIEIRAPASGAVIGLSAATVGGVIAPGQKLMDIVPVATPLRVSARIAPTDADDVRAGQSVQVRFVGLHERALPSLQGEVTGMSADSFTDENSGETYYLAEIRVGEDQINLVRQLRGREFELRPGMPAEVLVPLRPRSALSYMVEPLFGTFWSSFREQ
jgi:HlyD family secretion protein